MTILQYWIDSIQFVTWPLRFIIGLKKKRYGVLASFDMDWFSVSDFRRTTQPAVTAASQQGDVIMPSTQLKS